MKTKTNTYMHGVNENNENKHQVSVKSFKNQSGVKKAQLHFNFLTNPLFAHCTMFYCINQVPEDGLKSFARNVAQ